jgi:hypothetical protein
MSVGFLGVVVELTLAIVPDQVVERLSDIRPLEVRAGLGHQSIHSTIVAG